MGQFTTEQKSATMPTAAAKRASSPISGENAQPRVAPMNIVGTISPPLNPQPMVTAVKIILSKNAAGCALPSSTAFSITFIPAPL